MVLVIFNFAKDVEQKDAHILMKVLMIEEELRKKSQILAVDWIFIAIHLKNSNTIFEIAVYLISRRMEQRTYFGMFLELDLEGEETQAKITNVEAV